MTTRSWTSKLFARMPRTVRKAPARFRPSLEALEDRRTPATLTVNSMADTAAATDGYLSLRQALNIVNSATLPSGLSLAIQGQISGTLHADGGDKIVFDHTKVTGPITLGGNQLELTLPSTTAAITIDGGLAGVTVDGDRKTRVLEVTNGVKATLIGLTITNGDDSGGGGIENRGTATLARCTLTGNFGLYGGGGGVRNSGTMTISECSVVGNGAKGAGGISNSGTMTLTDSNVSRNGSGVFGGGGIRNSGTMTIHNCTVSSNGAREFGGGIENDGTLTITSSTLAGNTAHEEVANAGGGISNTGTLTIYNSIVANNEGGNILGTISGSHNLTGAVELGDLDDNGGPTQTMALPADSPALNAGDKDRIPTGLTLDQRGLARVVGGKVDLGAYERQNAPTDITLSSSSVPENRDSVTSVGRFSTTDADTPDSHKYTLVEGEGDSGNDSFSIDANGILEATASFDLETTPSYSIRVRSTDAGNLVFEKVFTISVTNLNEPPTADAGGPYTVAAGEVVVLKATGADVDADDSITFAWDLDNNGSYETTGQNVTFDATGMTPGSRTVNLVVRDALGASALESTTVNIVHRPEVLGVTPSLSRIADAHAGPGAFKLTVVFDVSMNTAFAPTLSFPNDDAAGTLIFSSGSWRTTNVSNDTFEALFDVADVDALFTGVDVRLEGGSDTVNDRAVNAVNHADVFSIKMNPPRVTAIDAIKYEKAKKVITYQVTFSEAVTGVSLADFAIKTTGSLKGAIQSVSGKGTTWFVKVKHQSSRGTIQLQDRNTIKDLAGNLLGGKARRDGDFSGLILHEGMFPLITLS